MNRQRVARRGALLIAIAVAAATTGACKPSREPGGGGGGTSVRLEEWCERPGLNSALRQTAVLIDERAVRAATGAQMREANSDLFELVMGLGDPTAGRTGGAMAPRERLSVHLAPADGGAPRLLFTGCVPGVTAEEAQGLRSGQSAVATQTANFMTGGMAQEIKAAQEAFRNALILTMAKVAREPAGGAIRPGGFESSSLLASLKASRLVIDDAGAPRFFIFTHLNTFPRGEDRTQSRQSGFTAAQSAEVNLGGADVFLVGPQSPSAGRDFAQAFFLGSQGNLLSWGGAAFNALPAAPVELRTYTGEIAYPNDRFPMRLVIGRDAHNRLVNSWLIVRSDAEWATPVGGLLTCADEVCRLVADRSGLAQVWSHDPDPDPEFTSDLPLSGMRNISAELTTETAKGEVFDPMVSSFDGAPGVRTLPFDLTAL